MASNVAPPGKSAKISLSLGSRIPPKPNSTSINSSTKLPKRPHALLSTDLEAEDTSSHTQTSQISQFGSAPNAATNGDANAPRVIAPIVNKGWGRANSHAKQVEGGKCGHGKRQKSGLPDQSGESVKNGTAVEEADTLNDEASKPKFGLNVRKKSRSKSRSLSRSPPPLSSDNATTSTATNGELTAEQKEDQEVIDRLMGKTGESKDTVITPVPASEDDAFRASYASAPPQTTLSEYEATPVEGFGAALMRGYLPPGETLESWKDRVEARMSAGRASRAGKGKRGKAFGEPPERRKDLLGLGATEMPELGLDKDSKGRKKGRREAMEYNPLARRNVVTGEVVGEGEFKERVEAGQKSNEREANGVSGHVDVPHKRLLLDDGTPDTREDDQHSSRRDRHRDKDDKYSDERRDSERREKRNRDRDYNEPRSRDDGKHRKHHERDYHDDRKSRPEHKHRDRSRERHKPRN